MSSTAFRRQINSKRVRTWYRYRLLKSQKIKIFRTIIIIIIIVEWYNYGYHNNICVSITISKYMRKSRSYRVIDFIYHETVNRVYWIRKLLRYENCVWIKLFSLDILEPLNIIISNILHNSPHFPKFILCLRKIGEISNFTSDTRCLSLWTMWNTLKSQAIKISIRNKSHDRR